MKNKKALLVIDMQKGSFTPETPRFDTEGVINRINKLSKAFRSSNLPVIIVQHDGTQFNAYLPGSTDWEIINEIVVDPSDIRISKTANDAFYRSELQTKLQELHITELIITGCATDFCIESTIQSALVHDYNVTVSSDGHTTGNRPHLNAEKIIEHYNWVWQNMIPTKGTIMVSTTSEILNSIK